MVARRRRYQLRNASGDGNCTPCSTRYACNSGHVVQVWGAVMRDTMYSSRIGHTPGTTVSDDVALDDVVSDDGDGASSRSDVGVSGDGGVMVVMTWW